MNGAVPAWHERATSFACHGEQLFGIVCAPPRPASTGVLIVVGGPQYRAGSHRQFTLLARHLASHGFAALRFDYRGMGDSSGAARDFAVVDDDLGAAIDHFFAVQPELERVVIWGLCDAAAAALFYAHTDPRVSGLVLVNPWARTDTGLAKATLKHYYLARLLDPALWRKIARGQFHAGAALASLWRVAGAAFGRRGGGAAGTATVAAPPLPQRLEAGLARFQGPVLLIICGADLTGREFMDLANSSAAWRALLAAPRLTQRHLAEADHTFSRQVWRDQVLAWSTTWLRDAAPINEKGIERP